MTEIRRLASHLTDGTLPEDQVAKKTCMKIALVFTCLAIRSQEVGEPIAVHIVEGDVVIGLRRVHTTWTLMVLSNVARWNARQFDKVAMFPITKTIDVYAAYERLLRRTCCLCDCEFTSDINRERCIRSHVNKKKPAMRCGKYPVDVLCDFWDERTHEERRVLIKDSQAYMKGVPDNASFSPIVSKFFEVIKGDVSALSGRDLMIAMDIVSENTFMYNVTQVPVVIVYPTRGDYLASMAHTLMRNVAEAQVAVASAALLLEEDTLPRQKLPPTNTTKKKKKKFIKAKKQPPASVVVKDKEPVMFVPVTPQIDEQELLRNVQKQKELEDQYAEEAYPKYIDRLEKKIFSRPAVSSIASWADFE